MSASATGTGSCRTGPGSGAGTGGCNPRKFSEKIALHTQRQAEETAAFQEVMLDITSTRIQAQKERFAQNQGSCYGGSLPNVNQIGRTIPDLQGQFFPDLDSTTRQTRHHGLVERVPKDRRQLLSGAPYRRRRDCSPYSTSGLSSVPSFSWRRTNSDSALHTSVTNANPSLPYGPGHAATARSRHCMFPYPVPPIEENVLDEESLLASWDAEKLPEPSSRPKSCDVPGIRVLPSQVQPSGAPLGTTALSTGGSLPDLTSLRFPTPLPPHQDELGYPLLSGAGSTGNLAATLTQLGITVGSSLHLPGLSTALQGTFNNPVLQSSLSHPNIQSSLSCHSSHGSLSSTSLQSSLSNPSLQSSLSSSPSLPSSLSSQSLHSSLSNSSLSGKSLQSAASSHSSSSGIGGSGSCSSSSSYSSLLTGQQGPPLNTSPRRRRQLSPLKLPVGTDSRWHHPKQFSPTMSPTLSSITQGVALDTSRLPVDQRLASNPYSQTHLCLSVSQQSGHAGAAGAYLQQTQQSGQAGAAGAYLQQTQQSGQAGAAGAYLQQTQQSGQAGAAGAYLQQTQQSGQAGTAGAYLQQTQQSGQEGAAGAYLQQTQQLGHAGAAGAYSYLQKSQQSVLQDQQQSRQQQMGQQPYLQQDELQLLQQHLQEEQPLLQQQYPQQPQLQSHQQQYQQQPLLQQQHQEHQQLQIYQQQLHPPQLHGQQQPLLQQEHQQQPQLQCIPRQYHHQSHIQQQALVQHQQQPRQQHQDQEKPQLKAQTQCGQQHNLQQEQGEQCQWHQQEQEQQQDQWLTDPQQPDQEHHQQWFPGQPTLQQQHQKRCPQRPGLDDSTRQQQRWEQRELSQLDRQRFLHQPEPQNQQQQQQGSQWEQSLGGMPPTQCVKPLVPGLNRSSLQKQLLNSLERQGVAEGVPAQHGPSDGPPLSSLLDHLTGRPGQGLSQQTQPRELHSDDTGNVQSFRRESSANAGKAMPDLLGSHCASVHEMHGQEKQGEAHSRGCYTKPDLCMPGSSTSGLSKEISCSLQGVPGFDMDVFGLDESLQMDPLVLEGLGLLEGREVAVGDLSMEDPFRSGRFL